MSKSSQRRRAIAARRFKQVLAASFIAASFFNPSAWGESPAQPIVNRYVTERQSKAKSEEVKPASLPPIVTTKALPGAGSAQSSTLDRGASRV